MSATGKPSSRRGRMLSNEEESLWQAVARGVKPLRKPRTNPAEHPKMTVTEKPTVKAAMRLEVSAFFQGSAPPPPPPKSRPALAPLDRRTKQKLARGREAIDARLDLHGMTQDQAHGALSRFLRNAQSQGMKFVIVVTGKGLRNASGGERGVLRREVPRWLGMPEFRDVVVGFEVAAISHGGEGALYVRVRRG